MQCPQCDHTMIFQNGINLKTDCKNCLAGAYCQIQSEEVMLAPTIDQMMETNAQTTGFLDANVGPQVGSGVTPLDYELADAITSADLADFLSRPVQIASVTWSQGAATGDTLVSSALWRDYVNTPAIKNKLQNYAFMRGNLRLKIITNASPFMYGSARAHYTPLRSNSTSSFKDLTIVSGSTTELIPLSQLPGAYITPSHSEGVEMTIPFIWPRSFLRVGVSDDFRAMGQFALTVYAPLQSANGSTSNVNVGLFAWMEDVVLAGPTVAPAVQSDEYGVGVVSAPASAIAAIGRKLADVPVIGRFAKATEIGASAVSKIATLFGFTNVPVITDTEPVRNTPFPQLATAHIGYPHEKLALDPKNELSIDPQIGGLSGEDELAIANFVQRESYLTTATWDTTKTYGVPLFTSSVRPQLGANFTYLTQPAFQFTPMGLLSTMFRNWRGDIIFRFKFIATPFHKGRVRISYDPYDANVQSTVDTGPLVFNKIVDLGAETDVEFRVPYQQALPWLFCDSLPSSQYYSTSITPGVTLTDTFTNGMISVKVLNQLSAPTTTSSIYMQVFVRGAENLQFSNPRSQDYNLTPYDIQSCEYSEQPRAQQENFGDTSPSQEEQRALVNFGESVQSLRTLLRRHNYLDTIVVPPMGVGEVGVYKIEQTRFPPHFGYDPNGFGLAKGVKSPTISFPFNYSQCTPWHLISNCFLMQRGSMNWVYNPNKQGVDIISRISRNTDTMLFITKGYSVGSSANASIAEGNIFLKSGSTTAGASLNHMASVNGHSITAPSYTPFKFQSTDPDNCTQPSAPAFYRYDGSVYDNLRIEYPCDSANLNVGGMQIERYFGIGSDYTLHFFLCCPTLFGLNAAGIVPA